MGPVAGIKWRVKQHYGDYILFSLRALESGRPGLV